MINKITLKNIASYDEKGIQIDDFKKINFIYGANGTGKTVISNVISDPTNVKYQNCEISWENNQNLKTLVYNKSFKEKNFGVESKLPGVFTLGQATKEEKFEIEKKKNDLSVEKDDIVRKQVTLKKQKEKMSDEDESFKEDCWKYYKKYDIQFKEAFVGASRKETFKNKLIENIKGNTSKIFSFDDLKEKAKTIFGNIPELIPEISTIEFQKILDIEDDEIWKKKIIGKSDIDIAALITKLNNNDWVNQGRVFLQENNEICPFCQQPTATDSFKQQLDEYFDASFTDAIDLIKQLQRSYDLFMENIINTLQQIIKTETENANSKLMLEIFKSQFKAIEGQYSTTKGNFEKKFKEPSRIITINSSKEFLEKINQIITNANSEIKKHNAMVKNFKVEKKSLITAIWKFISEEAKEIYLNYSKKISGLQTSVDNINRQVIEKVKSFEKLNNEIKKLNKNVTSIQPTIDEINRMLKFYGFHSFKIVSSPEKGYYQIQREDGSIAKTTLSEGEVTFITFLYYLQLTKGAVDKNIIFEDRILVVDDPISSLDSNILFIISILLKKIIKNIKDEKGSIKQLILLTHNVYFHKEVSFTDGRNRENNDTFFWILRKNYKVSSIQSFEKKNPIHSSYELLWQEIKERKNSGINVQNTMRRIIENYFNLLGTKRDDKLIQKFKTKEEQEICRSLICWLNDGSHCVSDDMYIESQDDITDKYIVVFKRIFEETKNIGHYNMMMGIE